MKKIGFIAMSGVRVRNAELLELGLTLPGFVERSKVIASLPSLSLLTLAALTPPGYDIEYREIADLKALPELPDDYDLVALTSLSAQIPEAYAVADSFLAKGIPVIFGGLHATGVPFETKAHCTSVAIGEGEPLWPIILRDFEANRLQPFYRAPGGAGYDLAQAPVPRFDLLDPDQYNRITVQTSRGCPHRCEFCASSVLLTSRYKLKPINQVLAELHAIRRIWPQPFIEFADDNSFVHTAHYKELLRALIPEGLHWFTEADIRIARDPELLDLMREAGCRQVLVGLESPRAASVDGLELKGNWKHRHQAGYREAIDTIQAHGVTVNTCFILGLDGDTPEVFDEVLDFVQRTNPYEVQVTILTPFPGTPLYSRLLAENRILRPGAWELCTLFDINHRPKGMSPEQLHRGFLDLVARLYAPAEVQRRRRAFRDHRRHHAGAPQPVHPALAA